MDWRKAWCMERVGAAFALGVALAKRILLLTILTGILVVWLLRLQFQNLI